MSCSLGASRRESRYWSPSATPDLSLNTAYVVKTHSSRNKWRSDAAAIAQATRQSRRKNSGAGSLHDPENGCLAVGGAVTPGEEKQHRRGAPYISAAPGPARSALPLGIKADLV